ncbi:C40 family peptidase [Nocardioides agariphilus]|uniref:C40 family peptidase n=1 Tax=Nocardioides agariphilus TaxID=433664 RepID=A0A930VNF8_9ACTN|nr:C40 family peptidase [Nocardioides agariphilus]
MRRPAVAAVISVTLLAGLATAPGWVAVADEDGPPSQADVRAARQAADDKASDVAAVQTRLINAQARLQDSMVEVAQAEEAFNQARWLFREARRKQHEAEQVEETSQGQLSSLREQYADVVVSSYEMSPSLNAVSAILRADGIGEVVDTTTTMQNAQAAMDQAYDDYDAAALLAGVATDQATKARAAADQLREQTERARDKARATQQSAAAEADAIAAERVDLIADLARLQGISVALAEERQEWLEEQAKPDPVPVPDPTDGPTPHPTPGPTDGPTDEPTDEPTDGPTGGPTGGPTDGPTDGPTSGEPDPTQEPTPTDTPTTPPPAPAGGASAAIAFAQAQIGDPYQWGAAGPDRWDCSGLTMKAWQAGGVSLPHYSVGQYTASTPISRADLRPGDLLFWGSSSSPSSIYHVALYVGGGMMIHAPRTGQDVKKASIDYWIAPNFFARP